MAPYGSDITEAIPVPLSNPKGAATFTPTGVAYDVAINGQPFFLMTSDETPYRRVTAQYRKQQYDQTREAGEQSLTGWWFRSQSSFHLGQGIKYFEPTQDENLRFQYTESKGLDVWTKGQATLILDTDPAHRTETAVQSNGRPGQFLRSIKWSKSGNTYLGCLMLDGFDIDKVYPTITASVVTKALTTNVATLTTASAHGLAAGMMVTVADVDSTFNGTYTITSVPTATTFTYSKTASNVSPTAVSPAGSASSNVTHFEDYTVVGAYRAYAFCDDGVYAYWISLIDDAGTPKTAMYKKLLTDDATVAATQMWKDAGVVVTDAIMEFTKERIVACINNKVYEITTTASALPTAVYTHPVDNFTYTSITSSGSAIYVAGYSGSQSNVQKFVLTTTGTMPSLTSAITAAEMPSGELIYKIYYYLGYMLIGTSKGLRVAQVADDGSLSYGALVFESEQPVYDFAARDRYVWCATNVEGNPGTTRVDLGQPLPGLTFPYAWDTYYSGVTGRLTTACAFLDGTDRLAFTTNYSGSYGAVYIESDTRLVSSGYLQTGFVRYNTLETKIFKLLQARVDTTDGGLAIRSIDQNNTEYPIGSFSQGQEVPEVSVAYPATPQEYLGFKFTLTRSTLDNKKGPLFTGYQLKSLPAVPRQRLIQFPLACFDREKDAFGVEVGYFGRAYERLIALENVENQGDTIRVQDLRTGESFTGLIEELDFTNKTPTDKRFSGFGGVLVATIRSV